MQKHGTAEVLTGAFVILLALGFVVYTLSHTGRASVSGYPLIARFDRIDGLNAGADVRIAGVRIGAVTDMKLDPDTFLAVVTMTIQDDVKLPKDTSAEITSESLLGGKFLSLTPGGDTVILKPGQAIAITQSSVSLEQLLGKFIFSVTSMKPADTAPPEGNTPEGNTSEGKK